MINIAIASKCKDDRKTISALLAKQEDFHIISIGKDGYDALKSAMTQRPDVIIMDFSMEDIDSPELAPIIKRNSPSTALIVLCSHEERNTVARALKAGISGCLLRQDGFNNLVPSIRSVFYGGFYLSKLAKNHAINYFSVPAEAFPVELNIAWHPFTSTELSILNGISRGYTDREIAKSLNINIGSLRNCISRVKKRTGSKNRTQAAIYALLTGGY
jgi:DNA-binding NarL/FixJ family response regulator